MGLFFGSSRQDNELGKFPARRRTLASGGVHHQCGEYRLELLTTETTTPTRRLRFHVRILGKRNVRVAYLRDYLSANTALAAAREWVEDREQTIRQNREAP
jgi:hypothetical protein